MALGASTRAIEQPTAGAFRNALGRFPTGVALVTAAPGGEPAGLIVNSLTSVSLEPPLLSFCPSRSSLTWARMRRTQRFGVNVLARRHEGFARHASQRGADRFAGVDWELRPGGAPLLTDALAALEREVRDRPLRFTGSPATAFVAGVRAGRGISGTGPGTA